MEKREAVLQNNYRQVLQRVRNAEQQFGRETGSVQLLPVSKTFPAEDIESLASLGNKAFAESYLQEAQEKMSALQHLELEWHFIGPVQSNKTSTIARNFHWVHSVDREKIARRLNEQRPPELGPLNICLQLNISAEASKSGVAIGEVSVLAKQVMTMPNLRLRGLMAIPARSEDFNDQRRVFRQVREVFDELVSSGLPLDTLSMGMSADLEAAIAEGSTIVRVGTDIFGRRTPPR